MLTWAALHVPVQAQSPDMPGTESAQSPAETQPASASETPVIPAMVQTAPVTRMLLAENFPNGEWEFYGSKKESALKDTWKLMRGEKPDDLTLVCTGEPYGYIRTRRVYGDFELGLQWRYPTDENGNSGLLIFTAGEDRLWPDSLQIQLHHSTAGSTFPSGAAKADNELRNVPALSRPPGQWNECIVTSEQGRVTVVVNGKKVGEVTGCSPHMGTIALQSEGSEIHFRNIWVREVVRIDAAMSLVPGRLIEEKVHTHRIRRRGSRTVVHTTTVWTAASHEQRGRKSGLELPGSCDYLPASCAGCPDSQVYP